MDYLYALSITLPGGGRLVELITNDQTDIILFTITVFKSSYMSLGKVIHVESNQNGIYIEMNYFVISTSTVYTQCLEIIASKLLYLLLGIVYCQ